MIAVIGAGVAGLAAARELARTGREVRVFEALPEPGGRIRSSQMSGFTLDRGFQVLLTSYHRLEQDIPFQTLQPRFFGSGALVWDAGKMWKITNPLAHPLAALAMLASAAFSPADKARIASAVVACLWERSEHPIEQDGEPSALAWLQRRGISPEAIERFFRPFFGGVLLDSELASSAALLRFYLRRFAVGRAFVPARGIGTFPAKVAEGLPAGILALQTPVLKLEAEEKGATGAPKEVAAPWVRAVQTTSGRFEVEGVILAVEAPAAAKLLQAPPPPRGAEVFTIYFSSPRPLYREPLIVLPAGRRRLVRHFVQISNIAPEYAPRGAHLLVATILDAQGRPPAALASPAEEEIREVFPKAPPLELLDILATREAVPPQPPGFTRKRWIPTLPSNTVLAGDYTLWGSTEAAWASGKNAARTLLKSLAR